MSSRKRRLPLDILACVLALAVLVCSMGHGEVSLGSEHSHEHPVHGVDVALGCAHEYAMHTCGAHADASPTTQCPSRAPADSPEGGCDHCNLCALHSHLYLQPQELTLPTRSETLTSFPPYRLRTGRESVADLLKPPLPRTV